MRLCVLWEHADGLRLLRCQAAPEGGAGKSLFNLRAWGANLVNNLLLGQEQKQQPTQEPSQEASQAELPAAESATAEQQTELRILSATTAEEESWEHWKEVLLSWPVSILIVAVCQ